VSLLAMTSCRPTNISQLYSTPVGAWLASDGGLAADHRPVDRPNPTVGASLLAKAV
jgi:hypothetical protein